MSTARFVWLDSSDLASSRRPKQDKRTLYVGGLDEDVGVEILRAAFIPFGEVTELGLIV